MNVLVTDGENRSALAVTRSLGKIGCKVIVTGAEARNLASCSRFCRQGLEVPDPFQEGASYVKAITNITAQKAIDVIFPMTDQSIYLLNSVRNRLQERAILACPPAEMMQAVVDKTALFRLSEKLGVSVPQTLYLANAGGLSDVIEKIDRYPVVVKPALSVVPEGQGLLSSSVRYASSRDELEHLYETNSVLRYPSMIQERIIGPGTGLFTLYDTDRHIVLFSHRRLREKPPSGGVSVVSESVPLDEEMVEASDKLLSAVGWKGVAMVEFKRDSRDGKARLMEINGRFWGSLQLAISCGVDFPRLLIDYLQGKVPPLPIRKYQVGRKLKWLFGTLDHLLIRLKDRGEKLNLPPDAPTRWQAVLDFLRVWEKDTTFDIFERKDLSPFLLEGRSYILQSIKTLS